MSENPSDLNKIETATVDTSDLLEKGGHASGNTAMSDLSSPPALFMQAPAEPPQPSPEPTTQPDTAASDD